MGHGNVMPSAFPDEVRTLFDEFTGSNVDEWGLRAALAIVRFRKRNGRSPAFSELFSLLLNEPALAPMTERIDWDAIGRDFVFWFRHHCAVQWRRRGWITWLPSPRSLRPGQAFVFASREWRTLRR